MLKIVLAVSQNIECSREDMAPDTDFRRMAVIMNAVLIGNKGHASNSFVKLFEKKTALDISQAIHILREYPHAHAYVSFSERIGIPLALLIRRKKTKPAHFMISHRLNTRAKKWLEKIGHWSLGTDKQAVICTSQYKYAEQITPGRALFVRYGVDDIFYQPMNSIQEDFVLSVGNENRDYETLIEAIKQTNFKLKILSSSPWSRNKKYTSSIKNEQIQFLPRLSYAELRELYDRATIVAVPLNDVEYAAGVNGVLEASCMKKPIIVSHSRGITDYVTHLENAFVVKAHNPEALSTAIKEVYADENLRNNLSSRAYEAVKTNTNLGSFVDSLVKEIYSTIENH